MRKNPVPRSLLGLRSDPPINRHSGPRIYRRGRSWFSLRAVPTRKPVVSGAAPYPKATARATADPPVHAKWPVRVLLRAVQPGLEVGGRMWQHGTPAMTTTPGALSAGSSATLTVGDNETRESTGRGTSPPHLARRATTGRGALRDPADAGSAHDKGGGGACVLIGAGSSS